MAHVAGQVVQPRNASLIPERVHGLRGASHLNPRGARSIVRVETTTSLVLCGDLHVRTELVFQVGVAPGWKQRSLETLNPFAKDAHAISLAHASPCTSVWTMPAIRSHAARANPASEGPSGRVCLAKRRLRIELLY